MSQSKVKVKEINIVLLVRIITAVAIIKWHLAKKVTKRSIFVMMMMMMMMLEITTKNHIIVINNKNNNNS